MRKFKVLANLKKPVSHWSISVLLSEQNGWGQRSPSGFSSNLCLFSILPFSSLVQFIGHLRFALDGAIPAQFLNKLLANHPKYPFGLGTLPATVIHKRRTCWPACASRVQTQRESPDFVSVEAEMGLESFACQLVSDHALHWLGYWVSTSVSPSLHISNVMHLKGWAKPQPTDLLPPVRSLLRSA